MGIYLDCSSFLSPTYMELYMCVNIPPPLTLSVSAQIAFPFNFPHLDRYLHMGEKIALWELTSA